MDVPISDYLTLAEHDPHPLLWFPASHAEPSWANPALVKLGIPSAEALEAAILPEDQGIWRYAQREAEAGRHGQTELRLTLGANASSPMQLMWHPAKTGCWWRLAPLHSEQQHTDQIARRLLVAVARKSGQDYLDTLMHHLQQEIGADYLFVGRYHAGEESISTLSLFVAGQQAANIRYALAGTPCAEVLGQDVCLFPQRVCSLFPADTLLEQMQVNAYLGAALYNSQHQPTGILVGLFKGSIPHAELVRALFRLFAERLGAELERSDQEAALRALNASLDQLAYHDALCDLPNRQDFIRTLDQLGKSHHPGWILGAVDIASFSEINDALGPKLGDQLLIGLAQRLRQQLPMDFHLARIGIDQFGFVGPLAELDIEHLQQVLTEVYVLADQPVHIRLRLGLSRWEEGEIPGSKRLQDITLTLNQAKREGRSVSWFEPLLLQAPKQRLTRLNELYRALEQNKLAVHYQPQVSLVTMQPIGMEALVRWPQIQGGFISPLEFIPLAESSGLIIELGEWVLRQAVADLARLRDAGLQLPRLSVNVSMRQFYHPQLHLAVKAALQQHRLPGETLELEITESVAIGTAEVLIERLHQLKDLGISIAIDDFGTGFSSLAYLKRLPIDRLKIDQSFIRELNPKHPQAAIARLIIELGRSLELKVIAEGVETPEQARWLTQWQCDEGQGYLWARPMSFEQLRDWLSKSCA